MGPGPTEPSRRIAVYGSRWPFSRTQGHRAWFAKQSTQSHPPRFNAGSLPPLPLLLLLLLPLLLLLLLRLLPPCVWFPAPLKSSVSLTQSLM
jgi:antibiotic biosynthesis monooxygenase (ABM) superfamily enzyme